MSTGLVDNWLNIDTFGAIYPFVGSEGFLTILGLIFWFGWHVWQHQKESAESKTSISREVPERSSMMKEAGKRRILSGANCR
jgi:hypothetical protein